MIRSRLTNDQIRTEAYDIVLKIFHAPNMFLKLFLLVFVCVATGLAAYTVIQSILSYLAFQVITTSRNIQETPTLFPQITICNSHIFTSQYALAILKETNAEVNPHINVLNTTQINALSLNAKFTLIQNIHLTASGKVVANNDTERQKLAHSLDDVLLRCKFNYQTCTPADFVWHFDSYYGNCFVFNSGFNSTGHQVPLKKSSVAGLLYGLQIDMYVNFPKDLVRFRQRGTGRGLVIRIENSSYSTDHNVDGVKIPPGLQTDVVLTRSFRTTLPRPYSDCEIEKTSPRTLDSDLYNVISHSNYRYTQQMCILQCYQNELISACSCSSPSFVSLVRPLQRNCGTYNETLCLIDFFSLKFLSDGYISETCLPLCPLECDAIMYRTSLRSNEFNGDLYADYIRQNKNLSADYGNETIDSVSESIVSMNVFYDSLSYEFSEETPQMDIVALVANIGGNLGLFLGVSLLSVCELIEILIEILFIKLTG